MQNHNHASQQQQTIGTGILFQVAAEFTDINY
jgi:hypothetical protein